MVDGGCLVWYELVTGVGTYLLHFSSVFTKQYIVNWRTLCFALIVQQKAHLSETKHTV